MKRLKRIMMLIFSGEVFGHQIRKRSIRLVVDTVAILKGYNIMLYYVILGQEEEILIYSKICDFFEALEF